MKTVPLLLIRRIKRPGAGIGAAGTHHHLRVLSSIDTRGVLGLEDECALVVEGVVSPCRPAAGGGVLGSGAPSDRRDSPLPARWLGFRPRAPLCQATATGLSWSWRLSERSRDFLAVTTMRGRGGGSRRIRLPVRELDGVHVEAAFGEVRQQVRQPAVVTLPERVPVGVAPEFEAGRVQVAFQAEGVRCER